MESATGVGEFFRLLEAPESHGRQPPDGDALEATSCADPCRTARARPGRRAARGARARLRSLAPPTPRVRTRGCARPIGSPAGPRRSSTGRPKCTASIGPGAAVIWPPSSFAVREGRHVDDRSGARHPLSSAQLGPRPARSNRQSTRSVRRVSSTLRIARTMPR